MAREKKLKPVVSSFTPDGDFLAILSPDGTVKIWNTSYQSLVAEWKGPDVDSGISYSCMTCSFVGKKRRKERGACLLLVLVTNDGNILVVDTFAGEMKWESSRYHPGGIVGLSFANKGRILHVVGTNGMVSTLKSENGELIGEFKASKKPISSLAFSSDEKILAIAGSKIRVLSLENGKELLKFPDDLESVQSIWISNDANTIVTSGFGEKHLQVWNCDLNRKTVSKGPVLSMKHPPVVFECKHGWNEDDGLVILSVSSSGIAYLWNLKTTSAQEYNPTKIMVKTKEAEIDQKHSGSTKKSRTSIITARLNALQSDGWVAALVCYGSINSPQFNLLEISNPGEDIVVAATDNIVKTVAEAGRENGVLAGKDLELEAVAEPIQNKKSNKKRAASDPDLAAAENMVDIGHGEAVDGVQIDDDWDEPTMGEKLESLNLIDNADNGKTRENQECSLHTMPPSADSVHVLLKQALNADDRALLLDCLYTQDEKVIANSVSLLNPSHVLKLLGSLISMIESRGAILVCALPWLRSLLLQHASGIMSQESSLLALNSLFQLIESRVSTFRPALQLQSCLDFLYAGVGDDGLDENETVTPIIYEDKDDESDEGEESGDAMETNEDSEELEGFSGLSDIEGSEGMSD
ncbi:U3 small nucleolar RNA-associated protein 5 [Vitis vinifera]|uniref:U3 small nucleolar RNA-associated protein 5 n=1 Tax=Vitis vinifera TaxID=29760 RepID=A0A438HB39_VITVI|nr:U3 small nucleolar RNA-associated protein 5 [Vitis vinifera]